MLAGKDERNTCGSAAVIAPAGWLTSPPSSSFLSSGVDCGVPPSVPNARPTSVGGTTYRSEATYDCLHGYLRAGGSRTAVCNAKGQWDGPDLVCKGKQSLPSDLFNVDTI